MKQISFFVLLLAYSFAQGQVKERRIALVIGNSKYEKLDTLSNAGNDAVKMSHALKNLDFDVITHTELSRKKFREVIKEFGQRVRKYDLALFYYAGHGIELLGKNYLIPIDAEAELVADVKKTCIPGSSIIDLMKYANNETNIIIMDACRSNPFSIGEISNLNDGLALMDAPKGSIISFATSPGNVASDGDGDNGLFTEAILGYIDSYDLEIKEMFELVRKEVIEKSHGKQVPWESTSLTKPLVLKRSPEAPIKVSILEGDSITFEGEGTLHAKSNLNDVSFVWYRNGKQISNTHALKVKKMGSYRVKGISREGQMILSDPIMVEVKSFVEPNIYILEGDRIIFDQEGQLHAKSNVSGKYTWIRNGLMVGNGPILKIEMPGLYNASLRTRDGREITTNSTMVSFRQP